MSEQSTSAQSSADVVASALSDDALLGRLVSQARARLGTTPCAEDVVGEACSIVMSKQRERAVSFIDAESVSHWLGATVRRLSLARQRTANRDARELACCRDASGYLDIEDRLSVPSIEDLAVEIEEATFERAAILAKTRAILSMLPTRDAMVLLAEMVREELGLVASDEWRDWLFKARAKARALCRRQGIRSIRSIPPKRTDDERESM